ncbi:MAG: deoxyguanosinetriphosphate triphosphohydrolase [Oscillospiraceae bacterium]|nr:deoxyguanosinetriphosphate triphosphohydrolase [Oscillospiraceae bacterium]MCL2277938.1 deoxyguanosinetriphosphate triphosphohydrolase [Oscillospiraceae bacterium]
MNGQNPREIREALEGQMLSDKASQAVCSRGRDRYEPECEIRTCYQRDIDRTIHCRTFRRLKRKTQVFLSPEGDHYRTRLTHTLEVSRISRTIARGLRLNEDLAEAIALAHDFGHTPFGHAGERALNTLLSDDGGFKHNEQSLRIVEYIEKNGKGLNLTHEVRDGVLCHTGDRLPQTHEGAIVRIADRIAYVNHDVDDAMRAGILHETDIPEKISVALGARYDERINTLVLDMIVESGRVGKIALSPHIASTFDEFRSFMYERVYLNDTAKSEEKKVFGILSGLFNHYTKNPGEMTEEYRQIIEKDGLNRAVSDYISGMTDNYAVHIYEKLFIPLGWQVR